MRGRQTSSVTNGCGDKRMSTKIITTSLKKEITTKWSIHFPGMGIYKPMWLMNVCGPLAVGIALLVKSDKTVYEPMMHIHNLCVPDENVSLNIPVESGLIYIKSDDDEEYINAIQDLKRDTYIPFNGDVDFDELIESLMKHYQVTLYKANLLKIMLYLAVWSGSRSKYENIKKFVDLQIADNLGIFGDISVRNSFISTFPNGLDDTEKVRETVKQQKQLLRLLDLPQRELNVTE